MREATRKGNQRGSGGVVTFWGIGYNQSMHGQHNAWSIVNLHLLTGNIGRPGACPSRKPGSPTPWGSVSRAASRVACRTTSASTTRSIGPGWPSSGASREAGLDNVDPAERLRHRHVGARALKGDDAHVHLRDPRRPPETKTLVRPALERTFVISQEIYQHAPNLLYSDVVFPAATWGEWAGGIYINSERRMYVVDGMQSAPAMTVDGKEVKDEQGEPRMCKPDMDIVIDKAKEIAHLLGKDAEKMFPYKKLPSGFYDPQEVYREFLAASKGTDADVTGLLEVEKLDGKEPYQQIRELRGIQWPAPTAELARKGGVKRRYMFQEEGWEEKPYGAFRRQGGKAKLKLCEQDYTDREQYIEKLRGYGVEKDHYTIDHIDDMVAIRDRGLTPELPDFEFSGKPGALVPEDKYPFWLLLGVVYEHFHTAKTIRGATTRRLLPEQYVELHPRDAENYGVKDGDWIRVITRRGSYQGRAQVDGAKSKVRPARNNVQPGMIFSPWNLSVADSAEPEKNHWLVNETSHRGWDPVSGQADFKKLAARIELVRPA
ncbi:MAG: molybdopterin dinucleotide binding domain-containing protein [Polyangiaceae bacterium]